MKSALANSAWCLASAPSHRAFAAALHDPARAQSDLLRAYLAANADTAFGREHHLGEVRTAEQFASRVPPRDYDEFAPWVDHIRLGEQRVLTAQPVRRLVPTSGSSAARKLIPYTKGMHAQIDRAVAPWIFGLYRQHPRALLGPAYWSVSPRADFGVSGNQASAVPIGFEDDAEYLGGLGRWIINAAMAVPGELREISDMDAWRYVTLLLLLRRPDLTLISVWHPSFLKLLLDALESNWDALVADIASGACSIGPIPSELRRVLKRPPDLMRARAIDRIGPLAFTRLWPALRVISCWADGHAASAAAALALAFPGVTVQPKGLIATEGIVSIPYRGTHPLAIRSHYLEFENDDDLSISHAADLQVGQTYRVLLTTMGGLCRYRLNDLVRVDGHLGRTPTVRFVGRTGLVSDRAGEKLSEGFVATTLARLFAAHRIHPSFALLAPDGEAPPCYTLYIDADVPADLPIALDASLGENPHYRLCRQLGQLQPLRIFRIRSDAYAAYAARLQQAGQRLGDIKPSALSLLEGWSSHFVGNYIASHDRENVMTQSTS